MAAKHDTGVALLLVNPEGRVLMIQELETNPAHGKTARQWSIPMETKGDGESDHAALKRLVVEELSGMDIRCEEKPFGSYQVMPHVWVRLYAGVVKDSSLPPKGAYTDGVTGHCWLSFRDAAGLWLRRGAWEMLRDYQSGQRGPVRETCRANAPRAERHFTA